MGKFIAIDVGRGDAFYLENEGFSILVDGGSARKGFPEKFQKITGKDYVDILICTHNDSDHANGILGYLESSLKAKEVWLPGSWTIRLNDLLNNYSNFSEELLDNICDSINIKQTKNKISEDIIVNEISETNPVESYIENIFDTLKNCDLSIEQQNKNNCKDLRLLFNSPMINKIYIDAITQANRIRRIAIAAIKKGCKIRWFEYNDSKKSGGIINVLEPINSVEIFQVPNYTPSAMQYIKLSRSNRESLVFYFNRTINGPGVLFSADSDFSFNQNVPLDEGLLVTAPHHGSEANKHCYDRLITQSTDSVSSIILIRSDCKTQNRPGKTYRNVHNKKKCTLCNPIIKEKKEVIFTYKNSYWKPSSPNYCTC